MRPKIHLRLKALERLFRFRQAQDIDHILAGIHILYAARRRSLVGLVVVRLALDCKRLAGLVQQLHLLANLSLAANALNGATPLLLHFFWPLA